METAKKKREPFESRELRPLKWPEGWKRTLIANRENRSAWKKRFDFYRAAVNKELERLGAVAASISRNGPDKEQVDPGVALWFALKQTTDYSWQAGLNLDSPTPTPKEIDDAFKQISRKHHPDMVAQGSGGDVEMFLRASDWKRDALAWISGATSAQLENCIPCDRFITSQQNLAAILSALRAFRQLDRVGIPAILERVMTQAFKAALPPAQTGAINVPAEPAIA